MRRAGWFLRSTAGAVLVAFGSLTMTPVVLAAEHAYAEQAMQAQAKANAKGDMGKLLVKVRDELRVLADKPDVLDRKPNKDQRKAAKAALKALRAELHSLDKEVRAEFAVNQDMIKAKKLAAVIQERQDAAVAQYAAEYAALEYGLAAIEGKDEEADARGAAASAYERLAKQKLERSQQAFDPNDLPNKSLKPDRTRVPKTDPLAWVEEGLVNNPQILVASTAPFDYSKLAGAGNPAYLAATTEVVLSDAIVAKAAALGNDPVQIYNWVRNNVVWQPTWGAIQDAELTLSAQRGNAFDISSLTIALLRASGIPARYVHGTIDVPEADFRSWMGDWQLLNPAIDFASAGGIPIQPITSGGKITKVRMEHIWVEAAIDFMPSRGAKNLSADTWLAMDPSFKGIVRQDGLDVAEIANVDESTLASDFINSGQISSDQSRLTGFDMNALGAAHEGAFEAVRTYVSQHEQDLTVGEAFGSRRIVERNASLLPSRLPNSVIAIGARYSSIPVSLEQRITFALGRDATGEPVMPRSFAWAELGGDRISLSFRPATPADEAVLRALLPTGSVTEYSQFPTVIPAYLVNVIPELRASGEVVLTGTTVALGEDVEFIFNPRFVGRAEFARSYQVPAGSYLSIAVVAGSFGASVSNEASVSVDDLNDKFIAGREAEFAALGREGILGRPFHAALMAYYADLMHQGRDVAWRMNGEYSLAAGLGSLGHEPIVDRVFSMPRTVRTGGIVLNIPVISIVGADESGAGGKAKIAYQVGLLSSALEFLIPEQLFSDGPGNEPGVSAVTALGTAMRNGQPIVVMDRTNVASQLSTVTLDAATRAEIAAGVAAGRQAIVHQQPISVGGWTGSGYLLIDLETGDGAYRISGGANGDYKKLVNRALMATAGALGYVDGETANYQKMVNIDLASGESQFKASLGKLANKLALVSLVVAAYTVLMDQSLDGYQQLGSICALFAAFGLGVIIGSAITAAIGGGVLAAIACMIVAMAIDAIANKYIETVFNAMWRRVRDWFV